MPEPIIARSDRVGLLTPVVWSDPEQFQNWNYSAIQHSFVTLAEFYLSYRDEVANCVKSDGWLCLMHSLGKGEQDPVLQKRLQAYHSMAKKLRGLTCFSLGLGAFGLKTSLKSGMIRFITVAALVNVAFGLVLCGVKMYLHVTRHPCKMGFAQRKVEEWLTIPKGECKRSDLEKQCISLSTKQNWELVQYAVSLMNSRLNELSENIRLIWIIQESLEIFAARKVIDVRQMESILPPLETRNGLANLIEAITKKENPSPNLQKIKNELSMLKRGLGLFGPQMAISVLEGIGSDVEFIEKMIPADKRAVFIGKLNGPRMSREEIKSYLAPDATEQDVEQVVKFLENSNAPAPTTPAPAAPAAPSGAPIEPPSSAPPD